MKKTMSIIALFVVLIFTVSSRSDRDYRASLGFDSPELSLTAMTDSAQVNLDRFKGRYVIVNFWAAFDAESRLTAQELERLSSELTSEQLCLLQVNLDPSVRLFREIVRRDRMNEAQQFTISSQEAEKTERSFNLENGLQSYLIDPSGKIVAVNPSPEAIQEIVAS